MIGEDAAHDGRVLPVALAFGAAVGPRQRQARMNTAEDPVEGS